MPVASNASIKYRPARLREWGMMPPVGGEAMKALILAECK
jgi:hypothetical protein